MIIHLGLDEKLQANEHYQSALKSLRLRIGSQQRCWGKDATGTNLCKPVSADANTTFGNLPVAQLAVTTRALSIIDQQDASFTQKIGHYRLSKIINPRDIERREFAASG